MRATPPFRWGSAGRRENYSISSPCIYTSLRSRALRSLQLHPTFHHGGKPPPPLWRVGNWIQLSVWRIEAYRLQPILDHFSAGENSSIGVENVFHFRMKESQGSMQETCLCAARSLRPSCFAYPFILCHFRNEMQTFPRLPSFSARERHTDRIKKKRKRRSTWSVCLQLVSEKKCTERNITKEANFLECGPM